MLSQIARSAPANVVLRGTRRTLSTAVQQSTSSRPPPFVSKIGKETTQRYHGGEGDGLPSLWIRPWDGILSMADGLAVLRAIERRYGKLKYYHFLRDQEVNDMYQPFCFAEFANDRDLEQISPGRHTIQLEVPIIERTPPGGTSLEDIRGLLYPEERLDEPAPPPRIVERVAEEVSGLASSTDAPRPITRVIDVQIERAPRRRHYTNADFNLNGERRIAFARSFVRWGGFYKPPPPPVVNDESTLDAAPAPPPRTEPSRKYMGAVMSRWLPRVHTQTPIRKPDPEEDTNENIKVKVVMSKPLTEEPPLEDATKGLTRGQKEQIVASSVEVELPDRSSAPQLDPSPVPQPGPERPRTSKRRERILELARKNARTPLPDSVKIRTPEQEEQKRAEAEQKQSEAERTKSTVRERLWKLMGGGGWF